MPFRVPTVAALGAVLAALGACATPPAADPATLASIRQNRDEATLANVERLALEPAVFVGGAEAGLSAEEAGWVLAEVDRQVCYELSERFTVLEPGQPGAQAEVRAAVTGLSLTNPAGSGLSAVANWFIPGPIGVRAPGSTGGLAAEAELVLVPDGRRRLRPHGSGGQGDRRSRPLRPLRPAHPAGGLRRPHGHRPLRSRHERRAAQDHTRRVSATCDDGRSGLDARQPFRIAPQRRSRRVSRDPSGPQAARKRVRPTQFGLK